MRSLMLIAMVALTATAYAQENVAQNDLETAQANIAAAGAIAAGPVAGDEAFVTEIVGEPDAGPRYERYLAYKQRLAERRARALELRRQYNASRGPAVYRTSTVYQGSLPRFVAIEQGWVKQPPIPMRPIVVVPGGGYVSNYIPPARHYPSPGVYTIAGRR